MVGLQVCEAHFDPLPLIAGPLILWRAHDRTRDVSGRFVHGAGYLAPGHVGAALRLQGARAAITHARPIEDRPAIVTPAGRPEGLAVRAPVLVLLFVEGEVAAREGSITAVGHLPYRNVRGDAGANEPAKELVRPVRCIGGEPTLVEFARLLARQAARHWLAETTIDPLAASEREASHV